MAVQFEVEVTSKQAPSSPRCPAIAIPCTQTRGTPRAKLLNNPRYLFYVANPYGEPRNTFQSGLDQSLLAQSSNGVITRGYFPLGKAAGLSDSKCFVIVLRKSEQFVTDQMNSKDLDIA